MLIPNTDSKCPLRILMQILTQEDDSGATLCACIFYFLEIDTCTDGCTTVCQYSLK
ncbi:MAG: hypothetical protein IJ839_07290 [Ruminobacter sp.]|nr:hypothetical protein [Ruminobacter sp.]